MYFNEFASSTDAKDLTQTEEFESLVESAGQFKIPFKKPSRYISRNIVVNGVRLHTLEWGDTSLPTVLMMHGNGLSAHTWDFVSLALSDRYHVVAIDQRGHGDSEWPRDWDMNIQTMVGDVSEIIGSMSEKPMVIAHSMSGRVSMSLFSQRDMAKKLVIVDIGPDMTRREERSEMNQEAVDEQAARARVEQQNWQWESVDAYVDSIIAADATRSPELVKKTMGYNLMQRSDGMVVSKVLRRATHYVGSRADNDGVTLDDLKNIACPTLVVRGEHSPSFDPKVAEAMIGVIPNSKLVTVARAGHNVHSQNTLGFLAEIEPFLAS